MIFALIIKESTVHYSLNSKLYLQKKINHKIKKNKKQHYTKTAEQSQPLHYNEAINKDDYYLFLLSRANKIDD